MHSPGQGRSMAPGDQLSAVSQTESAVDPPSKPQVNYDPNNDKLTADS